MSVTPLSLRPPRSRARNLAFEVVEQLTERIRQGALAPGAKLPTEAEITAEFGVSRTVVREALSSLQAAGLVETRHGIGTFVLERGAAPHFTIDPREMATLVDVLDVLELRISLEAEAAALAAARRTDENLVRMRRALDAFAANIRDGGDTIKPDYDFHFEVARATGNRHFGKLMSYLGTMIIPRTRVNSAQLAHEDRSAYLARVHREHEDIYAAIVRGDVDGARATMRTHLANSRERLRRAQEEAAPRAATARATAVRAAPVKAAARRAPRARRRR